MFQQGVVTQSKDPGAAVPMLVAAEPTPSPSTHWPTVPGVGGGGVLFAVGFVLLLRTRIAARDGGATGPLSLATRFVCAFALLVTGYHVCAWSLPADAMPLKVPLERWFWVPVLATVACVCSIGVDRVQRSSDEAASAGEPR